MVQKHDLSKRTYHFMIAHHVIELFINLLVLLLCVWSENIRARVHFWALRATLLLLVKSLEEKKEAEKGMKKGMKKLSRLRVSYHDSG